MQLTKHEGWGNDFLVLADGDATTPVTPELTRRVCDRRFGVGADGLLHLFAGCEQRPGDDAADNADGSTAEISGNGLRCLVQAALRLRWAKGPEITVTTGAGVHVAYVDPAADPDARSHDIRVDMGAVAIVGADADDLLINVGNPHRVRRVADPSTYDLGAAGAQHPDVNFEIVAVEPGNDLVKMRVQANTVT